MATNDYNPNTAAVFYGTGEHPSLRSEYNKVYTTGTLADDATYTLGAVANAVGFWRVWNAADLTNAAEISVDTDGTLTIVLPIVTGSNWAVADTDTDLCFFDDSDTLTIKNREGADREIHFAKLL